MNIRKKQQGITLIALAVTIIVMLILAGVTIAALTSENGIINQANTVKEKNKVAKTEEEARLEYSNLILEKQMEGHGEETELSDVIGKLEENGYETGEKDGKNYIKIGEYYYEIKLENEQVSIAREKTEGITGGAGGSTGIAGNKYDKDTKVTIGGKEVSIPAGATVSKISGEYENVDNGIVIYIINDDKANWDNVEYMHKTYDQFVWVPVDKNNVILDLSTTYATLDEAGIRAKVQEQINAGKYPMAIKTGTKTDNKDDYIGVLYQFTEETNGVVVAPNSNWTPKSSKGWTSLSSYREPLGLGDNINGDISSNLAQINGILGTTYKDASSFGKELQNQYNVMVEKVKNAGGFWIGRYETSNMDTNQVASKKGTTSGISTGITWYGMYANQSLYSKNILKNLNYKTTKTSSMIWGSQYDQIMIWMKNVENDKETTRGKYYVINGVVKGNYGKITIDGNEIEDGNNDITSPAKTGSMDEYRVKNIYDLAGNVWEWTLEAGGNQIRTVRGGGYDIQMAEYSRPDVRSFTYPNTRDAYHGSRLTIY